MTVRASRAVLVTHYFASHLGGVENVAGQLAQRIAQGGDFAVTWFASDCDLPPTRNDGVEAAPMRTWNGLERAFGLPWPVWGMGSLLRLKRAIAAAGLVHVHDFIYFGSLAAFLFARWHGTPILVTQHLGDIPYNSRFLRGLLALINRTIGRFVLSKSDQVIFYSEVVRAQFLRAGRFRTEPLFLQPNGVDPEMFNPLDDAARNALRATLADDPCRTVFLFVGRFVEKKGLPILHELVRDFAAVEWWFLGWGATSPALDPATWKLPNLKVFAGRSGARLAELYRAADLLVLPSKGEGFPLVVQEAMACGTPALISSATAAAVPDAGLHVFTCNVADGAPDARVAWAAALRELLKSGKLASFRKPVAAFAHARWSWDTCADQYRAIYRQLSIARR